MSMKRFKSIDAHMCRESKAGRVAALDHQRQKDMTMREALDRRDAFRHMTGSAALKVFLTSVAKRF